MLSLLVVGAGAWYNLATWRVRLRYPGEENFNEGVQLAEDIRLRQGTPIYRLSQPGRFDVANYGPLFYLLGARLVNPSHPAYFPLRSVSLAATIACAAACALLALWLSGSGWAALLAPLLVLSYGFASLFGVSARSDLGALALSFWGFLLAYRFRRSGWIVASAPLMLLGFFYKQQFVAGAVAVLVFLVTERRWRTAVMFLGVLVVGGLGLLALFHFVVFRGEAFLTHFIVYNIQPFSWPLFRRATIIFAVIFAVPLAAAVEFLRSHHERLPALYLACAVALVVAAIGKQGSDANYFLECVLILSTLVASFLIKCLGDPVRAGLVFAGIIVTVFMAQWPRPSVPGEKDFALDRAVQDYLRTTFPPRTRGFGLYTGDLVRAGIDAPISDLFIYSYLVRQGRLPDRELPTDLQKQQFGVILINFDVAHATPARYADSYLSGAVVRAILANYHLEKSFEMPKPEKIYSGDRVYVWTPGPASPALASTATARAISRTLSAQSARSQPQSFTDGTPRM